MNPHEREAAEQLLAWLAPREEAAPPFDAVIGFGHFDLRIAEQCAALFRRHDVPWLIFSGGIGAGTADLGQPEADAFLAHTLRLYPGISRERILIENRSTNTAENVRGILALRDATPAVALRKVLLVANPSRQRRVALTWRRLVPESQGICAPPSTTLAEELALFEPRRMSLIAQLVGEIDRLTDYPRRQWIDPVEIPEAVRRAAGSLRHLAHPER